MSVFGRRHLDLTARVGSVTLPNPVMTASGTSGQGAELRSHLDLSSLGAVVVKSLSAQPWSGNPPLRVHELPGGMINSVGLQNPGVEAWLDDVLPELTATGARVVASIWGFTVDEVAKAAMMVAHAPSSVVAVEVNLSCPNVEDRRKMFAHDPVATAEVVAAASASRRPVWAKLSPNVTDITEIAGAAASAGAASVTLVNTLMGMAIDPATRRYRLGAGGGGVSGAAIHPVAVRAVHDVRAAHPTLPIVGVGGVSTGADAVELLLAGASAIQVGTATFANPRAPALVLTDLRRWCRRHGVRNLDELIGAVHDRP